MNIKWFNPNNSLPAVTLGKYGISFNISSIEKLKGTKSVSLGFDSEQKKIYIKLNIEVDSLGFSIPPINEKTKYLRISCKEFIQFIESKSNIDLSESKKYYIDFSDEDSLISFNLKDHIKNKNNKRKGDRDE